MKKTLPTKSFTMACGLFALLLHLGCSPAEPSSQSHESASSVPPVALLPAAAPAPAAHEPPPVVTAEWSFQKSPMGPIHVIVTIPKDATPQNLMPVLIALHGQGESRKTPQAGARGWPYDYEMIHTIGRLTHPPLTRADFLDMVTDDRLARLNRSVLKRPYRGVIVVCPYLPDKFRAAELLEDASAYGAFITDMLLPKVYRDTPALPGSAHLGIDGVSLGGRAAIAIGLSHGSTFGAVGGTQAAYTEKQAPMIVNWLTQARRRNPELKFRILSSTKDRFKYFTEELSSQLDQARQPHQMDIVEGNHSYEFNRGPGGYEMLLYYDRVLRGEPFL